MFHAAHIGAICRLFVGFLVCTLAFTQPSHLVLLRHFDIRNAVVGAEDRGLPFRQILMRNGRITVVAEAPGHSGAWVAQVDVEGRLLWSHNVGGEIRDVLVDPSNGVSILTDSSDGNKVFWRSTREGTSSATGRCRAGSRLSYVGKAALARSTIEAYFRDSPIHSLRRFH